jgi:membrane protein
VRRTDPDLLNCQPTGPNGPHPIVDDRDAVAQTAICPPGVTAVSSGEFVAPARKRTDRFWSALVNTCNDFDRHDYLNYAGALAFFFLLSLFPLLIFLASLLAYLPIPNLFEQTLQIMGRVVPVEAMGMVRSVLKDVLRTRPQLLSFTIVWAVFAASGAINALITILNIAYDVPEGRSYCKKRLIAFGLTLFIGLMVLLVLLMTVLGPEFGNWLANHVEVGPSFAGLWPYFRWSLIAIFTVLSIEAIYFVGPNVKQRFKDQIPGAAIAVASWIGASFGFGWYVGHFAHYNQTFGTLGAVIALMMWFYITALALLLGAEINAELVHSRGKSLSARFTAEGPLESQTTETQPARRAA